MPTITRHSPDTCGCVVEIEVDDTGQNTQFLLMNNICEKHRPLASTQHRPDHMMLSNHVLDLIEEAKTKNLKQVNDLISKETSAFKRKDLMACRNQVMTFNARLDEEWAELTATPFAHDQHIHAQIMTEQQAKNIPMATPPSENPLEK